MDAREIINQAKALYSPAAEPFQGVCLDVHESCRLAVQVWSLDSGAPGPGHKRGQSVPVQDHATKRKGRKRR